MSVKNSADVITIILGILMGWFIGFVIRPSSDGFDWNRERANAEDIATFCSGVQSTVDFFGVPATPFKFQACSRALPVVWLFSLFGGAIGIIANSIRNKANGDSIIIGNDNVITGLVANSFKKAVVSINQLEKTSNTELAKTLQQLAESIRDSRKLNNSDKNDNLSAIQSLSDELSKNHPNISTIKAIWNGISSVLKSISDIASVYLVVDKLIKSLFY